MPTPSRQPPPSKLYKYSAANDRCLDNITKNIVYFQDPIQFNDPYDCALTMKVRELTAEDIKKLVEHYAPRPLQDSPSEIEKYLTLEVSEAVGWVRGVLCLTTVHDDILKWSHYGDMHRGIVLEYNTSFEPFKWACEVRYMKDYHSYDPVDFCKGTTEIEEYFGLAYLKAEQWGYEQEWRVLRSISGTMEYNSDALTGIYIGSRSSPETESRIRQLVGGKPIRLYKMLTSKTGFGMTHVEL